MTAIGSVTIDRTSLSLSALVIDTDGFNTYYVDKDGLGHVGRTPREVFATPSPFVHGQMRTAVVLDESTLNLKVRVQAASSSALNTALAALEDALFQFSYDVTVVVDGVTKVYTASPATLDTTDGLVAFERVMAHHEDLSIAIPVYPVAS